MTRKCQGFKNLYSIKKRLEIKYPYMCLSLILILRNIKIFSATILKIDFFSSKQPHHFKCSNKHMGFILASIIFIFHISLWFNKIHHSLTNFFLKKKKAWLLKSFTKNVLECHNWLLSSTTPT